MSYNKTKRKHWYDYLWIWSIIFFALVMAATIGQGSMVETFAHMRTPIMMSVARGIGGIVLGAGIGAVLMVFAEAWHRFFFRTKKA